MSKVERKVWKDASLVLYGGDVEKLIRKAAVGGEHQWRGVKGRVGLLIWRVVKFRVESWPTESYGSFYEGDSYIILHGYLKDPTVKVISYDIHIWVGENSTPDEYTTAMYKIVELDKLLGNTATPSFSVRDGLSSRPRSIMISAELRQRSIGSNFFAESASATQYREVMHHETDRFLSYFPEGVRYLEGGADSDYHWTDPSIIKEKKPSLWWVKGTRNHVVLKQVKQISRNRMNSGDVFILDAGERIWQWNGTEANPFEKAKAAELITTMARDRGEDNVTLQTLEQGVDDDEINAPEFCHYLPTVSAMMMNTISIVIKEKSAAAGGDDEDIQRFIPTLYKVGNITNFLLLATAEKFPKIMIRGKNKKVTESVYVLDNGTHVYIWIGRKTPSIARSYAMRTGQEYLRHHCRPLTLPIIRVMQEYELPQFLSLFEETAPESTFDCACTVT